MSEAIPEPEGAEPVAEAPEPEAQPEPQFDPQEAYGHLLGQVDEIRNAVASMYQAPVEEYGQPEQQQQYAEDFDPFDPNSFETAVGRAVQSQLEPITQALQPIIEQHNDARSEEFVNGAFERLGVPEKLRDEVLIMSGGYRLSGQSPEQAIASAYRAISGLTGRAQGEGRQEQRDELETIVTAPGVARSTQPGSVPAESRPRSMEEAAMRIASRMGIGDGRE